MSQTIIWRQKHYVKFYVCSSVATYQHILESVSSESRVWFLILHASKEAWWLKLVGVVTNTHTLRADCQAPSYIPGYATTHTQYGKYSRVCLFVQLEPENQCRKNSRNYSIILCMKSWTPRRPVAECDWLIWCAHAIHMDIGSWC